MAMKLFDFFEKIVDMFAIHNDFANLFLLHAIEVKVLKLMGLTPLNFQWKNDSSMRIKYIFYFTLNEQFLKK
ncbi:MAG: hypothetical protein LBE57_01115 [Methanosarcinales archaeon]|nr:hypothetical protein [Methanosarcinales archaeon]